MGNETPLTASAAEDILKRWSGHMLETQEAFAEELKGTRADHSALVKKIAELELMLTRRFAEIEVCYARDKAACARETDVALSRVRGDLEARVERVKELVDGVKVTAGIIAGVAGTILPVIVTLIMKLVTKT